MKVIEHIQKARNPLFSYEIIPPSRGRSVKDIMEIVERLAPFNPPWIDVTAHASTAYYHEDGQGKLERRTIRKRPGTLGICGIIQNRFKIDTVAHLLCLGFTKEETEDALIELNYLGIENILALRGDTLNYEKEKAKNRTSNLHASDLVQQLSNLRKGIFLEDISDSSALDFGVGVSGYPEKHFEAPNLKTDISFLKQKVDCGADYVMTQMFFDNQKYFDYVKHCKEAQINVPIIPGIKILKNVAQLKTLPKNFYIDIPSELADEVLKNPTHAEEIGINWATRQTEDLLKAGVPYVHYYVMNDTESVVKVVKKFQ
jgi:methylenetetrahydrofolate reductase (NADPH)